MERPVVLGKRRPESPAETGRPARPQLRAFVTSWQKTVKSLSA
jgi:hypothetical protein